MADVVRRIRICKTHRRMATMMTLYCDWWIERVPQPDKVAFENLPAGTPCDITDYIESSDGSALLAIDLCKCRCHDPNDNITHGDISVNENVTWIRCPLCVDGRGFTYLAWIMEGWGGDGKMVAVVPL